MLLIPTSSVESQDTRVVLKLVHRTPFLSYPSQLTLVILIKLKRIQTVCTEKEREREKETKTERDFFGKKNELPQKKI